MTAFEEQIYKVATHIAEKSKEEWMAKTPGAEFDFDGLAQRFACLMIQSRAQECRKLSGSLLLDPSSILHVADNRQEGVAILKAVKKMAQDLEERSHRFEQLALKWANLWPPEDNPAPGKLVELPEGMIQ